MDAQRYHMSSESLTRYLRVREKRASKIFRLTRKVNVVVTSMYCCVYYPVGLENFAGKKWKYNNFQQRKTEILRFKQDDNFGQHLNVYFDSLCMKS